jgi:hypothetical protein
MRLSIGIGLSYSQVAAFWRVDEMARISFAEIQDELVQISMNLRQARARMTPEEFTSYASGITLDEAAANDFVASDGSVESMTDRMWTYFESSLRPRETPGR